MSVVSIDQPVPVIAQEHNRWSTNRDVIKGVYAVKAKGTDYLPLASGDQTATEYASYQNYVSFYPAANRTLAGLEGLIFRHDPVLENAGLLESELKDVITVNGDTINEFAKHVTRETFVTNYTGLLIDHPTGTASSLAAQIDEGYRPFIGVYPAESILEVRRGLVRNRKRITYVRLLEEGGTQVRELSLVKGVYQVVVHHLVEGDWLADKPVYPVKKGATLNEIPFILVNTDNSFDPTSATMDHVVQLNLDHYKSEGLLTLAHLYVSTPMLIATGVEKEGDDTPSIRISPGASIACENADAKVYYVQPSGDGIPSLERRLERTEDKMATVASRILARQKAVAEAAETEALRQGAENSVIATIANSVSRHIQDALEWVTWWSDDTDVRFQLNTDYHFSTVNPQELGQLFAMYQGGAISHETLFYSLRDRDVLNETLTYAEELKRLKADEANEPIAVDTPDTTQAQ